jgi:hypothetical protein
MQKGTGMTDKAVQKLSKRELLEILVSQGKQIEKLQDDLKLANAQLEDKEISIENAGSIAEASLKINNIFADADAACQQYLDNIMNLEQQQQDALDRINEKEAELDRQLQQKQTRANTGRRTMPSWTASRMGYQPQEAVAEEPQEAWAPAQPQTRVASARSAANVRSAQPQPQPQVQYQEQPQVQYQAQPQVQYQAQPQVQYQAQPQVQYQAQPQVQYQAQPQVQYQAQPQVQYQAQTRATVTTAAPRATAARNITAAPRATATVTRPTTVTRTAQAAPAARATTVTRTTAARQAATTVAAAPRTKRRAS